MEEKVQFQSDDLKIEGLVRRNAGAKGVVITHPHPQYGGDMYNPVVEAIEHAYHQRNITTLRFNFRGVGKSEGHYGDGIGEQQDVCGAIQYLHEQGVEQIDLAGYSFGAWVNAHITPEAAPLKRMVMVSPPVAFMAFDAIRAIPQLSLVISGSRDEIAPVNRIETLLPDWNPDAKFEKIAGADHFYFGYFDELASILDAHV